MAAAIVQPSFVPLGDGQGGFSERSFGHDTSSPDKIENSHGSSQDEKDSDSDSDDEVKMKSSKIKKLNKSSHIISDESDSGEDTMEEIKSNDATVKEIDNEYSDKENDTAENETQRKRMRKKVIAFDDSDESDDNDDKSIEVNEKPKGSRRKAREKLKERSEQGSAMEKLIESRKRRKSKAVEVKSVGKQKDGGLQTEKTVNNEGKADTIDIADKNLEENNFEINGTSTNGFNLSDEENEKKKEKSSEFFSDSGSDDEDHDETIKKTYGTRRKTAEAQDAPSEDENERELQLKTDQILENKDIFDADSEESEEDIKRNESDDDNGDKESRKRRKKSSKPKKMKKSEINEMHSCQQKLMRNKKVCIPEHRPEDVSILDFLQRVPSKVSEKKATSKPKQSQETTAIKSEDSKATIVSSKLQKLISMSAPKITSKVEAIDFEFEDEERIRNESNSLMERLKKHTAINKQKMKKSMTGTTTEINEEEEEQDEEGKSVIDVEKINKATDTPGSRLRELKNQLQQKMRVVREVHRKEAEIRHKLENEEFFDEEEDEEDWGSDVDSEGGDSNGDENCDVAANPKESKGKLENDEFEEDDDEELKKWNETENRKQLEEMETNLQEAPARGIAPTKLQHSIDESTTASARTGCSSLDLFHDEDESKHASSFSLELRENVQWDESSTIPSGQNEAENSDRKSHIDASTPFTKLLKGRSRFHSSSGDKSASDIQNLDREEMDVSNYDESADTDLASGQDFRLALEENSQFSQVLDTQGYFNPRKVLAKERNEERKSIDNEPTSMTQLLGLCSGTFGKPKDKISMDDFGLPTDISTDDNSQFVLGLCSGKFTDVQKDSPAKPVSVLAKLLGQQDTQTADSQAMIDLCSGDFGATSASPVINGPVLDEIQSEVNLVEHFGEPKLDPSAAKSFNNLFKDQNARKKSSKLGICLDDESTLEKEALLDLCTGKFADDSVAENEKFENSPVFSKATEDSASIDYTNRNPHVPIVEDTVDDDSAEKKEDTKIIDNEIDDGNSNDVFEDDTGSEDNQEDSENEEKLENEENEELSEYYNTLPNKKFTKKQFYEEEAELSGSDYGDDDEDLGSEMDEYESESDIEDLPSEEKLKAQVHKAHLKATLAADKQDIKLIQERFYEDGDLLSDGLGRRRNFRWRNIDRPMNDSVRSDESDFEGIDEIEVSSQMEKRMERLERDAFLEEQRKLQETATLDENSQSILNIIKDQRSLDTTEEKVTSHPRHSINFKRQGSFLDRNKNTLTRLSSLTSKHSKQAAPTRSFVFQATSSSNGADTSSASKKIQRAASMSEQPQAKRAKIDRTLSNPSSSSIFSHL